MEFDFIETYHSNPKLATTVHFQNKTFIAQNLTCQFPKGHLNVGKEVPFDISIVHDYEIEIGPEYYRYYLDGKVLVEFNSTSKNFWINHRPYYLIINSAFGGIGTGYLDPEYVKNYSLPEFRFIVDHLKVMKHDPSYVILPDEPDTNTTNPDNTNTTNPDPNSAFLPFSSQVMVCIAFFLVISVYYF